MRSLPYLAYQHLRVWTILKKPDCNKLISCHKGSLSYLKRATQSQKRRRKKLATPLTEQMRSVRAKPEHRDVPDPDPEPLPFPVWLFSSRSSMSLLTSRNRRSSKRLKTVGRQISTVVMMNRYLEEVRSIFKVPSDSRGAVAQSVDQDAPDQNQVGKIAKRSISVQLKTYQFKILS